MPLFEETISIPSVSGDPSNVHLFCYGLQPNARNPEKKLICTDSCMSYNKVSFHDMEEKQKEELLNNGCRFNGYFVRTISGPYDLCFKIWTTHKSRIMNYSPVNDSEPDPSVARDAIIVDHNGDYFGVCSGPHLGFCQAQDLKLAGIESEITLPLAGVKLYFQKTKSRPAEIPYSAYKATFIMPEITPVCKPEPIEKTEEVQNKSISSTNSTGPLSDPIPLVVKSESNEPPPIPSVVEIQSNEPHITELTDVTLCSEEVKGEVANRGFENQNLSNVAS